MSQDIIREEIQSLKARYRLMQFGFIAASVVLLALIVVNTLLLMAFRSHFGGEFDAMTREVTTDKDQLAAIQRTLEQRDAKERAVYGITRQLDSTIISQVEALGERLQTKYIEILNDEGKVVCSIGSRHKKPTNKPPSIE